MRFYEFRRKLKEDQEQSAILLTALKYLHEQAKEKAKNSDSDEPADFSMDSLINYVQNNGYSTFEYENFVDAYDQIPALRNLISNFNEDTVTWNLGASPGKSSNPQDQLSDVSQLAKRAVNI